MEGTPSPRPASEPAALSTLRALLLGVFAFGTAGAAGELLLIGHTEEFWQTAPLALLALGLGTAGWLAFSEGAAAPRVFRALMVLFIATGGIGLFLHFRANVEFERELSPSSEGLELWWTALQGTAPPSLAPGTMVQLGLLGYLCTFRHPRFGHTRLEKETSRGSHS